MAYQQLEVLLHYPRFSENEFQSIGSYSADNLKQKIDFLPWKEELEKARGYLKDSTGIKLLVRTPKGESLSMLLSAKTDKPFNEMEFGLELVFNSLFGRKKCFAEPYTKDECIGYFSLFFDGGAAAVLDKLRENKDELFITAADPGGLFKRKLKEINIVNSGVQSGIESFSFTPAMYLKTFILYNPLLIVPVIQILAVCISTSVLTSYFFIAAFVFFSGYCVPGIRLYMNYLKYSKETILSIDKDEITVKSGNEKRRVKRDDIQIITRRGVPAHLSNFWGNYYYHSLRFKDGCQIIIPSLLMNDEAVSRRLGGIPVEEDNHAFPWIEWEN